MGIKVGGRQRRLSKVKPDRRGTSDLGTVLFPFAGQGLVRCTGLTRLTVLPMLQSKPHGQSVFVGLPDSALEVYHWCHSEEGYSHAV